MEPDPEDVQKTTELDTNIPQIQSVSLSAVVIRKDGTREDLGVLAAYHADEEAQKKSVEEGKGIVQFGAALLNKAVEAIRKVKGE